MKEAQRGRTDAPPIIAALAALLAPAAAVAAEADLPARAAAPRARVGLDTLLTRYGTSHERLEVLTTTVAGEVALGGGWSATATTPLALAAFDGSPCCRTSLGNLTLGAQRRLSELAGNRLALEGSVSLPTASTAHDGGAAARFAATVELPRNAGLYLPGVTTARLGVAAARAFRPGTLLTAKVALHGWRTDGSLRPRNQLAVPFAVALEQRLAGRLVAGAHLGNVYHPAGPGESLVHALSAGLAWRGDTFAVGARLYQPLDASFRRLGMRGVGVDFAAAL